MGQVASLPGAAAGVTGSWVYYYYYYYYYSITTTTLVLLVVVLQLTGRSLILFPPQ